MVPSDIAITVYLIDGSTEDVDRENMVKQYAISAVDYVEVVMPSAAAPGSVVGYVNLLEERISTRPKIYHYTVIDKTKDAWIRAYYSPI